MVNETVNLPQKYKMMSISEREFRNEVVIGTEKTKGGERERESTSGERNVIKEKKYKCSISLDSAVNNNHMVRI